MNWRNSDFIVYEIDREGQVARLTSFELPEKKQTSMEEEKPDKKVQVTVFVLFGL
jgi:hypothetical protein